MGRMFVFGALVVLGVGSALSFADGVVCTTEEYLGQIETLDRTLAIEIVDSIAYVAADDAGLLIYDVSDPDAVVLLGQYDTPGSAQNLAVFSNGSVVRVYVADGDGGVAIVTTTDPTSPSLWATIPVADARDVAVRTSGLFGALRVSVAAGNEGLVEYEIANVFTITQVESEPTSRTALAVEVQEIGAETFIYVSIGSDGVAVFEEGSMLESNLLTTFDRIGGFATDVASSGDVLFVANGNLGVDVYELSPDRTGGVLEDNLTLPSRAGRVRIEGDRMYIGSAGVDLHIAEIVDPTSPGLLSTVRAPGNVLECAIDGDQAWLACGVFGLVGVNVSDPARFGPDALLGEFEWTDGNISNPHRTVVEDGIAFVPRFTLEVLDVSTDVPVHLSTYDPGQYVQAVDAQGDLACAVYGQTLELLNISNPSALVSLGTMSLSGPSDVRIQDLGGIRHALVADRTAGMRVVDISDPTSPVMVGTYNSGMDVTRIAHVGTSLFGDTAYVIEDDQLTLVSLATLSTPAAISSYTNGGRGLRGLVVDGSMAYLTSASESDLGLLEVIDLTQPLLPTLVSSVPLGGSQSYKHAEFDLEQFDNMLVLGDSRVGVCMYSLDDPMLPKYAGSTSVVGGLMSLKVEGDRAYARSGGAFHIIDLGGCGVECVADLSGDGMLDFFDVSAFLVGFQAQDPLADWNNDGVWNFFDVSGFLESYIAGCP